MAARLHFHAVLFLVVIVLSAGAWTAPAADCDGNGIDDACDLDCGGPGGPWDVPGCGAAPDCAGNAVPDRCDVAAHGAGCRCTDILASNSTTSPDSNLVGPADDLSFRLGGRQVTYRFACGFVVDGSGPDFNVYEADSGTAEFSSIDGLASANGIDFVSVRATVGAKVDIDGDEAHGSATFARAFDLAGSGLSAVRNIRIDGDGSGASGPSTGFDLDAVGVINRLGLDCDADGVLDACESPVDCDGDGAPDACALAAGIVPDCNANGVLDECDVGGGTSGDCNSDDRPDECPLCPTVQVVFVMDTSTSMTDEGGAHCASISAVAEELESELVDVETELLGIMAPGTGQFACLTGSVADLYGTSVPPPNNEVLGACPGGNEVGSEDWGRATSVVAGRKPWPEESVRLVVPISDEGPWCGDPVTDPGVDRDSIKLAIQTSVASGVVVSPITGTGTSAAMRAMAQDLAHATGGEVFSSQLPEEDLVAGILGIIRSACRRSTDCNLNDRPDECDLADGTSQDCDADRRPDECEPDCNGNARNDTCEFQEGASQDGNGNGVPDECEGIQLRLGATDLAWTEAYAAIGYDVVRGSLLALRDTRGDFTAAVDGCVVNDTTATSWPQGADAAAGARTWYLVRAEQGTGPLTCDAPGGGQVGSRDAEIEASPNACP